MSDLIENEKHLTNTCISMYTLEFVIITIKPLNIYIDWMSTEWTQWDSIS